MKTLFPDGDYPSLKELKATKAELMEQRDKLRAELKMFTVEKRNLDVVWKNVQAILGRGRSIMAKQRSETAAKIGFRHHFPCIFPCFLLS